MNNQAIICYRSALYIGVTYTRPHFSHHTDVRYVLHTSSHPNASFVLQTVIWYVLPNMLHYNALQQSDHLTTEPPGHLAEQGPHGPVFLFRIWYLLWYMSHVVIILAYCRNN